MPTDHDQQSNDILDPLYTHSQPSSTHAPPFSSSTSTIASRRDPFPYYASDASSSGKAYATSTPPEESLDMHTYDKCYLGSTVYPDIGWTLSGMVDDCEDATQYSPALEHCWNPANESFTSNSDIPFRSSNVWEPYRLGAHEQATLSSWNMEGSHHNTSSSWYPRAYNTSYPIPESSYGESSFYAESQISSNLDEQSVHHFSWDPAGLCLIAMQQSGSQASGFPVYNEVFPGRLGESIYSKDLSEICETTSHTWDAKPEARTPQTEASSQISYDVVGIEESSSQSACSQCVKTFAHGADLTRHVKTVHDKAGRGYRCAFVGCSKVHKVWFRLDSFKKHIKKQHQMENIVEINNLVERSARGDHGLPMAMTSLFRLHTESFASHICHSVTL